jgi:hypothetical protein
LLADVALDHAAAIAGTALSIRFDENQLGTPADPLAF